MGTAIAERRQEAHRTLRSYLGADGIKNNLAMVLPKHMTPDRMIRIALSAATKSPKLLDCSQESIAKALMLCGEFGLEPNGYDAHLVPFGGEAVFIPDYKGLVKLAYQSTMVKSCAARAVYSHDHFKYKLGTGCFVDHVPYDGESPGDLVYAWAMAELASGGTVITVLNAREVAKHREKSASKNSKDSPWNTFPEAMWAKTAFKELSKWIPKSPLLQRAVQHDDILEFGDPVIFDSEPKRIGTSQANDTLKDGAVDAESEEGNAEALENALGEIATAETSADVSRIASYWTAQEQGLSEGERSQVAEAANAKLAELKSAKPTQKTLA